MRRSRSMQGLARRVTECAACPRLAEYVHAFKEEPRYWARPVPGFGDHAGRVLVLGLAPGAHGANRTGRPFTGDGAGVFLYKALHAHGFATSPTSLHRSDGLRLADVYISNAVKCAPPRNRPLSEEINRCAPFLREEVAALPQLKIIVALGRLAHDRTLHLARETLPDLRMKDHPFAHLAVHELPPPLPVVIDSFHPSRYNVNVGKLTWPMFSAVFERVREILA